MAAGYRKLGMSSAPRRAMLRNLVTSLLEKERIVTTDARAKEVRRLAEKMITLGKEGSLASRRRAAAFLMNKDVVRKVFTTLSARYAHRNGGYTRIIKLGPRRGDAAPMSIIELV